MDTEIFDDTGPAPDPTQKIIGIILIIVGTLLCTLQIAILALCLLLMFFNQLISHSLYPNVSTSWTSSATMFTFIMFPLTSPGAIGWLSIIQGKRCFGIKALPKLRVFLALYTVFSLGILLRFINTTGLIQHH
jgi:hypothetical protein